MQHIEDLTHRIEFKGTLEQPKQEDIGKINQSTDSNIATDPELKSSYDSYVQGHEFLPIYQGLLNNNPNLKGNSANDGTDNSTYFSQKGWTIHPVVSLSK